MSLLSSYVSVISAVGSNCWNTSFNKQYTDNLWKFDWLWVVKSVAAPRNIFEELYLPSNSHCLWLGATLGHCSSELTFIAIFLDARLSLRLRRKYYHFIPANEMHIRNMHLSMLATGLRNMAVRQECCGTAEPQELNLGAPIANTQIRELLEAATVKHTLPGTDGS